MKDSERYKALCKHRSDLAGADSYTINRVNYDFLLNAYNKHLKSKAENERLKRELKSATYTVMTHASRIDWSTTI